MRLGTHPMKLPLVLSPRLTGPLSHIVRFGHGAKDLASLVASFHQPAIITICRWDY